MEPTTETELAAGKKNVHGKNIVNLSKALSWLLRHGAKKEGLGIRADGYVNLEEVMGHNTIKKYRSTIADIFSLVDNNEKKRFELQRDNDTAGKWLIRAV